MHVNNVFAAESLRYTKDKPNLLVRSNEIADFSEIMDYCARIQENLLYDENNVFYEKIEEGIEFWEWLYGQKGSGKEDDRRMLMVLLECSDDPKHRDHLWFPFTYVELLDGETVEREKEVLCEPHLKLIRRDSDLRIYFWWCDDKVGEGQKVLVGHIGRHPY